MSRFRVGDIVESNRDSGAARNHIPDAGKKVDGWTEKEKIEFKKQLLDAAENGFNATEKRLDQLMELYLLHNGIEKFATLALRSIKRYAWAEREAKKLQGVGVIE